MKFFAVFSGIPSGVRNAFFGFRNPEGIKAFSPAVATKELPWVRIQKDYYPERVPSHP